MTSLRETIEKIIGERRSRNRHLLRIGIGVLTVILIAAMFPHGESIEYSYSVGSMWTDKDLTARFSFPIYKDLRTYEKERQEAADAVYPVVERNDSATRAQVDYVHTLWSSLQRAANARLPVMRSFTKKDSVAFHDSLEDISFTLSDKQWEVVHNVSAKTKEFEKMLTGILTNILQKGIIDQRNLKQARREIAVRHGKVETIMSSDKVYDMEEATSAAEKSLEEEFKDDDTHLVGSMIVRAVLRPNLIFNARTTNQAIQLALENVPRTVGYVREYETIIRKNDRITEETKAKLDSYEKAKVERGAQYSEWKHTIGITLHVIVILGVFGMYLFLFRKEIFHDNTKLALIALLVLMEAFFGFLSLSVELADPIQYLIFVPAASMLLTIVFDSRVGFYGTVTIAFLIAGIRGNDYAIALISLVAGSLGAYTVRDIRSRTQIFRSLVFIFVGYAMSILALSIERFESVASTVTSLTFAFANSVISTVLTYGLLIFFERVFNVTTDLTLLELADFNHPLLQELSEKAPGTFHHSITLGSLAESAAEAIGANAILARVGAYYHDIGKILKPEYFMENQGGAPNKHNRLRARMSALIIASHVKDGVELARERGLPESVVDFIPQHHGTTRISFFYDKALKQAIKRPPKGSINEADFRYPGPKPQTRETGIVMLADSVEATTRSINDMTPLKLETTIDTLIKQRYLEGQLDECELTLKDLSTIKDAFLKILVGVHHQRITYPEQDTSLAAAMEDSVSDPRENLNPPEPGTGEFQEIETPSVPQSEDTVAIHGALPGAGAERPLEGDVPAKSA